MTFQFSHGHWVSHHQEETTWLIMSTQLKRQHPWWYEDAQAPVSWIYCTCEKAALMLNYTQGRRKRGYLPFKGKTCTYSISMTLYQRGPGAKLECLRHETSKIQTVEQLTSIIRHIQDITDFIFWHWCRMNPKVITFRSSNFLLSDFYGAFLWT